MKAALCILLAMVACSALTNAEQKNCNKACGYSYFPQCGYNGDCYTEFANECQMEIANCNAKTKYKLEDLKKCNQARDSKDKNLKYCPYE